MSLTSIIPKVWVRKPIIGRKKKNAIAPNLLVQESTLKRQQKVHETMNVFKYIKRSIAKHFKKSIILGMILFCLIISLLSPSYGNVGSLEGKWRLVSFNGQFVYRHLDGITAEFEREENQENTIRLTGLAGCSFYFGELTTNSDRITFDRYAFFSDSVINDSRICLWPTQEKEYLAAIQSVTSYKIGPGTEKIPDTNTIPDLELQLTYGGNKTLRYIKYTR